jgi:tRNA (mo5U34)-methyltransferase
VSRLETLQSDGGAAVGPLAGTIRQLGPWFHNLRLEDGTETAPDHPLGDYPAFQWQCIRESLPFDVAGLRVLDVGCNAGFYAFEMSRLGGTVVAIDLDEHYLRQARWAQQFVRHGRPVEFRRASVYDVGGWRERYDLINFMGVFYHLRYPLLALDMLAGACERWLIFQSITRSGGAGRPPHATPDNIELSALAPLSTQEWPTLAFIEHRLAGDPSNWWVPNEPAVFAMLRTAGFEVRRALAPETWLCERTGERTGPRLDLTC